ncbi:MAG: hypothetical protein A2Y63_03380 [Candidatus Riflebacteria bacterium RBG_13_59_9]|nr:MAG: hypothetical protein A2Y63_03380 [Candidatus Riflebacteria bacterium RBG_13_59_9]
MSDNLIVAQVAECLLQVGERLHRQILHASTERASYVVVVLRVGVEVLLRAADLERLHHVVPAQCLEVAVDGAQANARQTLPDGLVDFVGCGMAVKLPYLLKDDPALPGHPQFLIC